MRGSPLLNSPLRRNCPVTVTTDLELDRAALTDAFHEQHRGQVFATSQALAIVHKANMFTVTVGALELQPAAAAAPATSAGDDGDGAARPSEGGQQPPTRPSARGQLVASTTIEWMVPSSGAMAYLTGKPSNRPARLAADSAAAREVEQEGGNVEREDGGGAAEGARAAIVEEGTSAANADGREVSGGGAGSSGDSGAADRCGDDDSGSVSAAATPAAEDHNTAAVEDEEEEQRSAERVADEAASRPTHDDRDAAAASTATVVACSSDDDIKATAAAGGGSGGAAQTSIAELEARGWSQLSYDLTTRGLSGRGTTRQLAERLHTVIADNAAAADAPPTPPRA